MEARVAKLHGLPYLGDHLRGRRSTRSTPTSGVVNQFVNTLSTGRFPNRLGWIPTLLCPLRWLKRCTEVPHASTLIVPTSTLSYSRPACGVIRSILHSSAVVHMDGLRLHDNIAMGLFTHLSILGTSTSTFFVPFNNKPRVSLYATPLTMS